MSKPQASNQLDAAANALGNDPLVDLNKAMDMGGDYDEDEDDEDEDDEEDDEDEEDEAKKSLPNENDLLKSLDALAATANAAEAGVSLRETQLAARAAAGDKLSKSERSELAGFLLEEESDDTFIKSHAAEFAAEPTVVKGMEISDFLEAQTMVLAKSLDAIHTDVRTSAKDQEIFNGILAKSISHLGRVVVSQAKEIQSLRKANAFTTAPPAGPQPRAKGRSRIGQKFGEELSKSLASQQPNAQQPLTEGGLSSAILMSTMEEMIKSTEPADGSFNPNYGIVGGVDLNNELIKYESTGIIGGPALALVAQKKGMDPSSLTAEAIAGIG